MRLIFDLELPVPTQPLTAERSQCHYRLGCIVSDLRSLLQLVQTVLANLESL